MKKLWAAFLPMLMIGTALVASPVSAPVAHAATTTLSPANPIKMENFYFHSSQPTRFIRPVELQKQQAGRWKTIYTGHTDANGKFRFTVHTGSTDTLRGYSPTTTYKGHSYPRIGTTPITVRPLDQKVSLSVGKTAITGRTITATAVTSPGRAGRGVELQMIQGGSWHTIASGKVASNGRGVFRKTAGKPGTYTYRILMAGYNGAPRLGSSPVTVNVGNGIGITDPKFLSCIDEAYGLPAGAQLSAAEAADTVELVCYGLGIKSLQGIQAFKNLEVLDLGMNQIEDVTLLKGLTAMQELYLDTNRIASIAPLKGMTKMTELYVADNQLTSIDAVSSMPNLEALDFSANNVADLTPLSTRYSLQAIWMDGNKVTDISALKDIWRLEVLSAPYNEISDLTPLVGNSALTLVDLRYNQVSDPQILRNVPHLTANQTYLWYTPYCKAVQDTVPDVWTRTVCANTEPVWNSTTGSQHGGTARRTQLGTTPKASMSDHRSTGGENRRTHR